MAEIFLAFGYEITVQEHLAASEEPEVGGALQARSHTILFPFPRSAGGANRGPHGYAGGAF